MTHELFCQKRAWHGRESFTLGNGLIRLATLIGGGHIAELRFEDSTGLPTTSPLWVPPWETIEPYRYRHDVHAAKYGPMPGGKLISGLVGHNICLDYFGPPSPEEARQGLPQHGEAACSRWRRAGGRVSAHEAVLALTAKLPAAGLRFRREIHLHRGESVVYFKETVTNEGKLDHFFHWVQHVTLGPPFLSSRDSTLALPGTRAVTFPYGYDEGKALLAAKREFRWPLAPSAAGGRVNLSRPFSHNGLGFVAGVLVDPNRDLGFVAALNAQKGLLIAYCFSRRDFPWVAIWEENRAIAAIPWKRRTQAVGLEFGTTPLPVPRHENFTEGGPLFGVPTVTCVPARGTRVVRYAAFLAQLPAGFGGVRDIKVGEKEFIVLDAGAKEPCRVGAVVASNLA